MAHFEFHSYLASKFSNQTKLQITTKPLQGGFTNLTIRASFQPPVEYETHLLESVILKYAPPFVASDPTQPLSVYRQTIEAEALRILSGSGDIPAISELLQTYVGRVRVPQLVYHDVEENILWISDLGETNTLSKYLTFTPTPSAPDIKDTAIALGSFLGKLFVATRDPAPDAIALLSRPNVNEIVELVGGMTKKSLLRSHFSEAESLAARVEEALRDGGKQEQCIGMVDLWPESILIDSSRQCGLIDWEYFGLSNAASEIGMLLAHLHILTVINQSSVSVSAALRQFISSLLRSFVANMQAPSAYFKHRALVTHGRELINGFDLYSDKLDALARDAVVQAGVNSLRAAGRTEVDINLPILSLNGGEWIWADFGLLFSLPEV
ncbi:kinase-like domain-containing protein [Collybia nuda]|uniref:Kinase-like domain-containing protein n=1 Tax=Collybia nuda TaxID=64659 RepID=A0A9P6CGY7_9AGAR|nr:kinase-like domain-containing protein [Collybia nuda]